MKILIIGADGQLGTDLCKVIPKEEQIALTIRDIDITDKEKTFQVVKKHSPDIVINTAAYHNVNQAEVNKEQAFEVNANGVKHVADACREVGATLVHISTDYVFNGEKGEPYVEDDIPDPLSEYGKSKLKGEQYVKDILDKYYIVRTTGLYGRAGCLGKGGGNFVETIYNKDEAMVIDEERLSPTYTLDLVNKINQLIGTEKYGLYHIVNKGECSWYEFAVEIFRLLGRDTTKIIRIKAKDFGAQSKEVMAKRPKYSVLKNAKLEALGMDDMRPWQEALKAYLEEKKYI